MSSENPNLLERYPLVATLGLIVIGGVLVAVITANMSGVGGAIGSSVQLILPWLAIASWAIAIVALGYIWVRIATNWPKRLASGVLQVGTAQAAAPAAAARPGGETAVTAGGPRHRRPRRHGRPRFGQGRDQSR